MHLQASHIAIEEMVIPTVLLQSDYFKQFLNNDFS